MSTGWRTWGRKPLAVNSAPLAIVGACWAALVHVVVADGSTQLSFESRNIRDALRLFPFCCQAELLDPFFQIFAVERFPA
jgi:hypothetical protein